MTTFQAPPGTRDTLAPESARFEHLVAQFSELARRSGYGLIVSPMFEDVGVFRRGVGEQSEVVTKEMYEFEDKGGRQLALRPEGTASVVRAYIQHRPPTPYKAWYLTPAFRYERQQAGRYRQHHQLGAEALGTDDPDLDVEVITLLYDYLREAGLSRLSLRVNSMGDENCIPEYKRALLEYLREHESELCHEHVKSYEANPLRVLDCKRAECIALREKAPRISDSLCAECRAHFARVLDGLDSLSIAYERDDFLVRGLDYYTRTTFEFASLALESAQNAVGGGGRYDGLASALGGPRTPGIGFGSGIERVMLAQQAEADFVAYAPAVDVFVIDLTDGKNARDLTASLRRAGLSAERAFDGRSLKAQLREADRSAARLALIVGANEVANGTVALKNLRAPQVEQESVARAEVVKRVQELLS